MKDYYAILGIDKDSTSNEVKKAYRLKALKHHPDRNQGSNEAAEKFKELAEAYGVLIDPHKRRQYDRDLKSGFRHSDGGQNFRYTQEEIFRDLFNNPKSSQTLHDILKEFEKAGLRFDRRYIEKIFFGGRSFIVGGFFFLGMFGPRKFLLPMRILQMLPTGSIINFIGKSVAALLTNSKPTQQKEASACANADETLNISYAVTIPHDLAQKGTFLSIALPQEKGNSNIKVKIPAKTSPNTRMCLKNKGREENGKKGDLILTIHVQ